MRDVRKLSGYSAWRAGRPGEYHIDKDMFPPRTDSAAGAPKYYGPDRCRFLPALENSSAPGRRNAVRVQCLQTGAVWPSIEAAARACGVKPDTIRAHLQGLRASPKWVTVQ